MSGVGELSVSFASSSAFVSTRGVRVRVGCKHSRLHAESRGARAEQERPSRNRNRRNRFGTSKVPVLQSRPRSRIQRIRGSIRESRSKLRVPSSTRRTDRSRPRARLRAPFPRPPATPRDARVRVSRRRQEESRHTARPRERPPRLELPARCSIRRRRRPPRIIVPRTRPNRLESRTRT